jgi:hypothetical protein
MNRLESLRDEIEEAEAYKSESIEELNEKQCVQLVEMKKMHATKFAEKTKTDAYLLRVFKGGIGGTDAESLRMIDEYSDDMELDLAQLKDVQDLEIAQLKDMQALLRAQMDERWDRADSILNVKLSECIAAAAAEAEPAATEAAAALKRLGMMEFRKGLAGTKREKVAAEPTEEKVPTKEIDGKVYLWDPETNGLWENIDGNFGPLVGTYQPDNAEQPILAEEPPAFQPAPLVKLATLNKRKSETTLKRLGMTEFRKGLTGTKGEKRAATIKERQRREAILAAGQAPDWTTPLNILFEANHRALIAQTASRMDELCLD